MRLIYSMLFYCALPFVMARMAFRSLSSPAYRRRWNERLALYPPSRESGSLWFHAVSVGEAEAAFPLIRAVQDEYPSAQILVTTTTPTGSARVVNTLGDSVRHVYLPFDLPDCVNRFLSRFNPSLGIIIETEIWPNLYAECHRRHIPLALVNARLSERSARAYAWVGILTRDCFKALSLLAAQTLGDAQRYLRLGMNPNKLVVTGNIKFDAELSPDRLNEVRHTRETLFADRPIWIAGSTHLGEDEQVLAAHKILLEQFPDLILILVPRHPERMEQVATLVRNQGFSLAKRSEIRETAVEQSVYLLDTLGELKFFYATADVAFVGGSLVPTGGHNLLEPAAVGLPVLFGPHVFNFKDISERIKDCGAGAEVADVADLTLKVGELIADPLTRTQWGIQAQAFVNANQGAARRVLEQLTPLIESGLANNRR